MDGYLNSLRRRYINRIYRAKPAELVKINLEMALDFIENKDLPRARKAVCQLAEALDFRYGLSLHLYNIYTVIEKKLTAGIVNNELPAVDDAKYLIRLLLDKWKDTANSPAGAAGAKDSRHDVYIGLTYNASGLCEYDLQDYTAGFKA